MGVSGHTLEPPTEDHLKKEDPLQGFIQNFRLGGGGGGDYLCIKEAWD